MKKQILVAFLSGILVPVALMGLMFLPRGTGEGNEVESDGLTPVESSGWDETQHIMVLTDSGNIRQMGMGEYLVGVVLAEMPVDFDEEALKAQAVVARTYTCKRREHSKHDAAAVCTDSSCCQGYRDPEDYGDTEQQRQKVEKVRRAVEQTDGEVLIYGGELIDATYFSCSGGSTEDAVAVWGQDVPYLQAVDSPGEEDAPRYTETLRYTPENFRLLTGVAGTGDVGSWFGGVRYTNGGGVDTIEICGQTYSGTELRGMLGLRSTMFQIRVSDGMIVIETKGFGHRVGMSQYGAQAMALEGTDYAGILSHYYTGTVLTKRNLNDAS